MAQSFISELGDRLGGDGVANTEGEHVKTISAEYYKRNDSGTVSNQSLQTAIDGKEELIRKSAISSSNTGIFKIDVPTSEAFFITTYTTSGYKQGLYAFNGYNELIGTRCRFTTILDGSVSFKMDSRCIYISFAFRSDQILHINLLMLRGHCNNISITEVNSIPSSAVDLGNSPVELASNANRATPGSELANAISAKADDSAVVHLAGDETITGEKKFYNKWPYYRSSYFTNNTKTLLLDSGISYNNWAENLKDGNHFRHWKVSFGKLNQSYFIFSIGLRSTWSSRNSVGLLQKTIACLRTTALYSSYTQIIGPIATEYRISDLKQETTETGDNWYIDIVSNIPTSNNSLYAILELSASQNWDLQTSFTVSSTYDIIEGWPAWAGDINTTPRLQSSNKNVLLEGDTITSVAIGSASGKPLITTTNGVVTTGAFGTSAGQFAEGNTVGKVTATAKTDNAEYKLLATASASPTSGTLTEAVYNTGITMNPSTNTLTANLSGIATYAKALDPQMILNTTLYKVPVISADKEVRWSGAPGASGSTTELTYDNTDSKNLLSVNVTGYATSLEHAFAGSTVNETPIINVSGSTDGFKLTYGATTADLGITKLYTTDDANAKLSFGNMVSSTYKEAIGIVNGIPSVPTAAAGTNTTQIASTAFVQSAISGFVSGLTAEGTVSNTTGTPSVTITPSTTASGTKLSFAFTNIKGAAGTNGTNGTSAYWFSGTAVTGTGSNISATVSGSKEGDMYLNTSTCRVYKAIAANKWSYITNILGDTGATGPAGPTGPTGPTSQWYTGTAMTGTGTKTVTISGAIAGDMYLNSSTGEVYKANSSSSWTYQCTIKGAQGPAGPAAYEWVTSFPSTYTAGKVYLL